MPSTNLTNLIMGVIAAARRREDVVPLYAEGILAGPEASPEWRQINAVITDRWSTAGLIYIKRLAWAEATRRMNARAEAPCP